MVSNSNRILFVLELFTHSVIWIDPVAYRIEPFVYKHLAKQKPVQMPYTKGGLTGTLVGMQDFSTDLVDKGRSMIESMRLGWFSTTVSVTKMVEKMIPAPKSITASSGISEPEPQIVTPPPSTKETQLEPILVTKMSEMECLNPRKRIDYVLQENVLDNPYLSVLAAHCNYWTENDAAVFILKEIYKFPVPKEFLKNQSFA